MIERTSNDWIEAEYRRMKTLYDEGDLMHNRMLHKEILEDWEWNHPKMFQHLKKEGTLDKLADDRAGRR